MINSYRGLYANNLTIESRPDRVAVFFDLDREQRCHVAGRHEPGVPEPVGRQLGEPIDRYSVACFESADERVELLWCRHCLANYWVCGPVPERERTR
jgi:hypothetical protein